MEQPPMGESTTVTENREEHKKDNVVTSAANKEKNQTKEDEPFDDEPEWVEPLKTRAPRVRENRWRPGWPESE